MFKRPFSFLLSAGFLFLLVVACANEPPPPTGEINPTATATVARQVTQETTPPDTSEAYPSQLEATSPYPEAPTPMAPLSGTIEEVPEPSSDSVGTVTGVIVIEEDGGTPAQETILYLGRIIMLDTGQPGMSALDKQTAPLTQTNLAGQFIFSDIEPGNYTLILDRITDSFVLNQPGGGDLIIPVEGGQITDLGELRYPDLPLIER